MGYSTQFDGVLKFTQPLTLEQAREIESLEGEDIRDSKIIQTSLIKSLEILKNQGWNYIDLQLADNDSGIEWNGSEKSYDMVGQVNYLLAHMRSKWPEFGLSGEMLAQGDEIGDVWKLVIRTDWPSRKRLPSRMTESVVPSVDIFLSKSGS